MEQKYPGLHTLIAKDVRAREYYKALPGYVQDQIGTRAQNVNSFESLRDYAENLLRGDN